MADTIPFDPLGSVAGAGTSSASSAPPAWLESADAHLGPALGELPETAGADFPLEAAEPHDGEIRAEGRGGMRAAQLPELPELSAADADATDSLQAESPGEDAGTVEYAGQATDNAAWFDEPAVGAESLHAEPAAAPASVDELAAGSTEGVSVEWPPEEQRRIVSVRIVSTSEQRLSGRATRQALAACGFVHGRYRIFHQPDAQGHALLSCASLSKPGVFDPSSMDYQRYSGLSLFTVLPGPLSPPDAVNRLLHTALDLSERLHARLQDDAGQTLDEARIAELLTRYRKLDATAGPPE